MKILLTNDDGFFSLGLQSLKQVFLDADHDLWVVAPDSNRSGMSHYITVNNTIRVRKVREKEFRISGSPADCIRVALAGCIGVQPDIIISGINHGPNLGSDIIYSGTAAAARQGACMNIPSVAVSIWNNGTAYNFSPLAQVIAENLEQFVTLWDSSHFININGPNHSSGSRSIVFTHPCLRIYKESPHCLDLPGNDQYWFLDGSPMYQENKPGSDLEAVQSGHISLSPIYLQPISHDINQLYEAAYTRG